MCSEGSFCALVGLELKPRDRVRHVRKWTAMTGVQTTHKLYDREFLRGIGGRDRKDLLADRKGRRARVGGEGGGAAAVRKHGGKRKKKASGSSSTSPKMAKKASPPMKMSAPPMKMSAPSRKKAVSSAGAKSKKTAVGVAPGVTQLPAPHLKGKHGTIQHGTIRHPPNKAPKHAYRWEGGGGAHLTTDDPANFGLSAAKHEMMKKDPHAHKRTQMNDVALWDTNCFSEKPESYLTDNHGPRGASPIAARGSYAALVKKNGSTSTSSTNPAGEAGAPSGRRNSNVHFAPTRLKSPPDRRFPQTRRGSGLPEDRPPDLPSLHLQSLSKQPGQADLQVTVMAHFQEVYGEKEHCDVVGSVDKLCLRSEGGRTTFAVRKSLLFERRQGAKRVGSMKMLQEAKDEVAE